MLLLRNHYIEHLFSNFSSHCGNSLHVDKETTIICCNLQRKFSLQRIKTLTHSLQMYTMRLLSHEWVSWSDSMLNLTLSAIEVYSILGKCQREIRVERLIWLFGRMKHQESSCFRPVPAYNPLELSEKPREGWIVHLGFSLTWSTWKGGWWNWKKCPLLRGPSPCLSVRLLHPVPGCSGSLSLTTEYLIPLTLWVFIQDHSSFLQKTRDLTCIVDPMK